MQGSRHQPPLPSLGDELGGKVDVVSLDALLQRLSSQAFQHVRSALHRLDMARELIASGCIELQTGSTVVPNFRLVVQAAANM